MTQNEIKNFTNKIIMQYAQTHGINNIRIAGTMLKILDARGIKPTMPMYATARLMVLRDLLRVWEAV